jgi:hypothetical protein
VERGGGHFAGFMWQAYDVDGCYIGQYGSLIDAARCCARHAKLRAFMRGVARGVSRGRYSWL